MTRPTARRRPARRLLQAGLIGLLMVSATGCTVPNFGFLDGITVQSHEILDLWKGSTITALAVGVVTWAAIFWAIIAYRKRSDELPRQVHSHMSVEVVFTVLPFIIVAGLFYYTVPVQNHLRITSEKPDVTIGVTGFRWNWEFRHEDAGVSVIGRPGEPPTLVLPAHKTIRFEETSPDVIHSFWVPKFLFKMDVIPGHPNSFEVTIDQTGTFVGRCAEYCGTDHDRMNFVVKVVEPGEYTTYLKDQKALALNASGSK